MKRDVLAAASPLGWPPPPQNTTDSHSKLDKLRKLGWHASDTAELFFDQGLVPAENLIGEECKGFFYLLVGAIRTIAGMEHL